MNVIFMRCTMMSNFAKQSMNKKQKIIYIHWNWSNWGYPIYQCSVYPIPLSGRDYKMSGLSLRLWVVRLSKYMIFIRWIWSNDNLYLLCVQNVLTCSTLSTGTYVRSKQCRWKIVARMGFWLGSGSSYKEVKLVLFFFNISVSAATLKHFIKYVRTVIQ